MQFKLVSALAVALLSAPSVSAGIENNADNADVVYAELEPYVESVQAATREVGVRGLLETRQGCPSGYGYCSNTGRCCPLGGECCSDGNCCRAGWQCWISHTGQRGCCPNGRVCS